MPNSIQFQTSMRLLVGAQRLINEPLTTVNVTPTGTDKADFTQDIPTTAGGTQIVFPAGMSTLGYGFIENTDPANAVQFGRQVGGTFYPLGEVAPLTRTGVFKFACTPTQLYMLGIGGTVKTRICASEA